MQAAVTKRKSRYKAKRKKPVTEERWAPPQTKEEWDAMSRDLYDTVYCQVCNYAISYGESRRFGKFMVGDRLVERPVCMRHAAAVRGQH